MQISPTMHVDLRYFLLLQEGKKTVELRLNDEKRREINVGDRIRFICKNAVGEELYFSVTRLITATSFAALIREIPLGALGGISLGEQLKLLSEIYSQGDELKYGTIAVFLGSAK